MLQHHPCCFAHLVCTAGVAAAFRSPVGGVLFALEEMTSWFRNELLWYAFFTTAVVSVAGKGSTDHSLHVLMTTSDLQALTGWKLLFT